MLVTGATGLLHLLEYGTQTVLVHLLSAAEGARADQGGWHRLYSRRRHGPLQLQKVRRLF